jgi:hypothetical protein
MQGVRVRVEIGPKEAEAGTAILARAKATPGTVARKQSVNVKVQLVKEARAALEVGERGGAYEGRHWAKGGVWGFGVRVVRLLGF